MRLSRLVPIVTLVGAVTMVAAGVLSRPGTAFADDQTVSWGLPATSTVTVSPGDAVTWRWADDLPHTVTSVSGPVSFDSGTMSGPGQTFAVSFAEPGTYTYRCNVHPSNMTGTVVVQAAAPTPAATASPTPTSTATASPAPASTPTAVATATASPVPTNTAAPAASPTATVSTPEATPAGSATDGGRSVNAWLAGALVILVAAALAYGGWRAWR